MSDKISEEFLVDVSIPRCRMLSAYLVFDPQLISHHGDEFAIGRFRFADVDRIAEQMTYAVNIAARPSYFNRMANCPLNA